ncbi:MarR family transcriptional regulator [Amycolatopsis mediterranei S699]|uniref:MarR family transcriptional regulator n=2 Tax=Amycolatopsis mediterranei TaxID=33910 RepID=A0A0H3D155_AMYMU|nr:MarR family transcriptional regulator [Amycolatopsis mediterranei]ADJ44659.1 MarR family transcriptional regulator [Amycolatopsis mediterranei U32]AEK41401.1 MarR family transcriptional regulator [Amycolatopsis mediterranei S699]AFO76372.1 MarR family transcriptional regulator [Amycolatopsis mediterranei S699]AGT83501.1 MarR family transcriptional regulator [Amycolatopsis mediterranei RB]KDO06981.1 MarR family transcriptional regulator [Amycolatopsis mediterranei]
MSSAPLAVTQRLGYLLKHAQLRLAELAEPLYAPLGVTGRQLALLMLFGDGPARSQQDGAARLGVDRTTMVALVDELEAKGLVRREVAPGDRRKRLVLLTPEGERVREAGAEVTRQAEALLLEPLSADDAERLRAALHQVVRAE